MKIPRNYPETLEFLYAQLPMFQRQGPMAFKKDLTNTRAILKAIGNPEKGLRFLHVGGTNGKGSLSSMLNSILMESGYSCGLYTSPHLKSFTERIRVNGHEIAEQHVVDFVQQHHVHILDIRPSFFELTFAMAIDYFAARQVDVAVIEVGLGGRLDSTNVIMPELCAITNISLDHQAFLGDNRPAIAGEKAGIIKAGVPVIIGEYDEETAPVFEQKAAEVGAPLTFAPQELAVERVGGDLFSQQFQIEKNTFELGLGGTYQLANLRTCMLCVEKLQTLGWQISEAALRKGLIQVKENSGLRGRMEILQQHPLVLADTAHNLAGVRAVMAQLAALGDGPQHIVWGMANDKEIGPILELLPKSARYYFVKPDVPRGMDAASLARMAAGLGLRGEVYDSVVAGLQACLQNASADDICYVGGSTFVVAEVV